MEEMVGTWRMGLQAVGAGASGTGTPPLAITRRPRRTRIPRRPRITNPAMDNPTLVRLATANGLVTVPVTVVDMVFDAFSVERSLDVGLVVGHLWRTLIHSVSLLVALSFPRPECSFCVHMLLSMV